jgi:hypothetical protein
VKIDIKQSNFNREHIDALVIPLILLYDLDLRQQE